jgi:hypothetical protein
MEMWGKAAGGREAAAHLVFVRHKTNKSFWRIKRILQYRFNVTVVFLLYLTRQTYQLYLILFVLNVFNSYY